jgi:[ribosomal protein S5]-alanine N-acetyltransferase
MREPVLRTKRLVVRLPRGEHASALCAFYCRNREFLQPWSPSFDASLFDLRDWQERIEASRMEFNRGVGVRFILLQEERVVGIANFTSINGFPQFSAMLGYSLDEYAQGRGLMAEALEVAIPYVFEEFRLHRIYANYMPRNERSGRLLKKLGFQVTGYVPEYLLINGVWEDHIQTSLINPDWEWPPVY